MSNQDFTNPLIRIELESLKSCLVHAFSKQMLDMDEMFNEAVKRYCTPENIESILNTEVKRVLDKLISETVSGFFTYGKGRDIVAERVKSRLNERVNEWKELGL